MCFIPSTLSRNPHHLGQGWARWCLGAPDSMRFEAQRWVLPEKRASISCDWAGTSQRLELQGYPIERKLPKARCLVSPNGSVTHSRTSTCLQTHLPQRYLSSGANTHTHQHCHTHSPDQPSNTHSLCVISTPNSAPNLGHTHRQDSPHSHTAAHATPVNMSTHTHPHTHTQLTCSHILQRPLTHTCCTHTYTL